MILLVLQSRLVLTASTAESKFKTFSQYYGDNSAIHAKLREVIASESFLNSNVIEFVKYVETSKGEIRVAFPGMLLTSCLSHFSSWLHLAQSPNNIQRVDYDTCLKKESLFATLKHCLMHQ